MSRKSRNHRPPADGSAVTPRSGELCMYWRGTDLPPGAIDVLADAYCDLLAGLDGDPHAWFAPMRAAHPGVVALQRSSLRQMSGPPSR